MKEQEIDSVELVPPTIPSVHAQKILEEHHRGKKSKDNTRNDLQDIVRVCKNFEEHTSLVLGYGAKRVNSIMKLEQYNIEMAEQIKQQDQELEALRILARLYLNHHT